MHLGDKIRMVQVGVLGACAPACLYALLGFASERFPLWWAIPFGVATGLATTWAASTFFGITQLHQLAARSVHGGRHYYFGLQELRVVFDDDGCAWMRLDDVRLCVGGDGRGVRHYAPAEATLVQGAGRHVYLSVAGVRRYLRLARHADLAAFTLWFERDFVIPLERRRERNLPLHSTGGGRI
jgi:hypothetical protein